MSGSIFLKLANFCLYRNIKNNRPHLAVRPAVTTIFYDHACALCRFEMQHLKRLDKYKRLTQIDISAPDFVAADWSLNPEDLDLALHVLTPSGEWLVGMPAVRHVYRQLGMGCLMAVTELPGIAALFDSGYLRFARNRTEISGWFGLRLGLPGCTAGACSLNATSQRSEV